MVLGHPISRNFNDLNNWIPGRLNAINFNVL
jgi:hypothetical protein